MLSAMSAPRDRIKVLRTGVDEYLAKPFEPEELLLRIENVIRRSQSIQQEINIIKIGFFSFDVNKNILSKKNASVKLTVKEAKVLLHLYKYLGNDVKREKLASDINVSTRTIDVLVKRIREKMHHEASRKRCYNAWTNDCIVSLDAIRRPISEKNETRR